ncbi:MAG: hypothetical protein ABI297_05870, partial [Ginsengibacter sp.]
MKQSILIILIATIIGFGCSNNYTQNKPFNKIESFNFPENDLSTLPPATHASLTQVYDDHALENRIVTFRDERLLTSRGINTIYDDMPVYKSKQEWEKRKEFLRQQILVAAGLWPM